MPNWCSNLIYFCAMEKKYLEELHSKFSICKEKNINSIYEVLDEFKVPSFYVDGRDYLDYVNPIKDHRGYFCFAVQVESAWRPSLLWAYKLVEELYGSGSVWIRYFSEELGSNIFESNDLDKDFFEEEYRLEYNLSGEGPYAETYSSKENLLEDINQTFNTRYVVDNPIPMIEGTLQERVRANDGYAYVCITEIDYNTYYDELCFGGGNKKTIIESVPIYGSVA